MVHVAFPHAFVEEDIYLVHVECEPSLSRVQNILDSAHVLVVLERHYLFDQPLFFFPHNPLCLDRLGPLHQEPSSAVLRTPFPIPLVQAVSLLVDEYATPFG